MAPYAEGAPPLPATDDLARTNIALPMGPTLSEDQTGEVVAAIAAAQGQ
jgi:dTDP-4-amino-4,6-dideoxygalactose transaminase